MSPVLYDQYYCTWSERHGGAAVVSSSSPQNNSEMLDVHLGMKDLDMSETQCCRMQYSPRLDRFLWVRSRVLQDESNRRRTYLSHILHTNQPDNSPLAAAQLSLLSPMDGLPPESAVIDCLEFDREFTEISIKLDPPTLKGILYTMLFNMPRNVGICAVCCSDEEYNSMFPHLALFLIGLMPKRLARTVSVSMNPRMVAQSSLINIVNRGADTGNCFLLQYSKGQLSSHKNPVGNPIRNAFCDYLAELFKSNLKEYYEEFDSIVKDLEDAGYDKLPLDSYLYCRWAEDPNHIYLDQDVKDAIVKFLEISSLGSWNKIPPERFSQTLQSMCRYYLNLNDESPSKQPPDYDGLIGLLNNCRFPACLSITAFFSRFIQSLWEEGQKKQAWEMFHALHRFDPSIGNDVNNQLLEKGIDILKEREDNLTLRDIGSADTYDVVIWDDRFREKVIELLMRGIINPYENGSLNGAEKRLPNAVKTVEEKRPDWFKEAVSTLKNKLKSAISVDDGTIPRDVDKRELWRFRCLQLNHAFKIDGKLIAEKLIEIYDGMDQKSSYNETLTDICRNLGIDHYIYESHLEQSPEELKEYIVDDIRKCNSLCDRICRLNELISVRKNLNLGEKEKSALYRDCVQEAWDMDEESHDSYTFLDTNHYHNLSQMVDGRYPYQPVYHADAKAVPVHKSIDTLQALFSTLSNHLFSLHQNGRSYARMTENALTTALMVKIERAIDECKNPSRKSAFLVDSVKEEYKYCYFNILLEKWSTDQNIINDITSKEILDAMREVIQYIPCDYIELNNSLSIEEKIRLTATRILFGDSDEHLETLLQKLGQKNALHVVVLAAILSGSSNPPEATDSVNNAYKRYKKTFHQNMFHNGLNEEVPNIVSDIYFNDLRINLCLLKAPKLNSDLKNAINKGIKDSAERLHEKCYQDSSTEASQLTKQQKQEQKKEQKRQEKEQKKQQEKEQKKQQGKQSDAPATLHSKQLTETIPDHRSPKQPAAAVPIKERTKSFISGLSKRKKEFPSKNKPFDSDLADGFEPLAQNTSENHPQDTAAQHTPPADNEPCQPVQTNQTAAPATPDSSTLPLLTDEIINRITSQQMESCKESPTEDGYENQDPTDYNNETINMLNGQSGAKPSPIPPSPEEEPYDDDTQSEGDEQEVAGLVGDREFYVSEGNKSSYLYLQVTETDDPGNYAREPGNTIFTNDDDYFSSPIPDRTDRSADGRRVPPDAGMVPNQDVSRSQDPPAALPTATLMQSNPPSVSGSQSELVKPHFVNAEQKLPSVLALLINYMLPVTAVSTVMAICLKAAAAEMEIKLTILTLFGVISAGAWLIGLRLDHLVENESIRTVRDEIRHCIRAFVLILFFTLLLISNGFI